jgi:hypothetical protein
MPVGQGARNNIVLGGLGRPNLFDTNVKATSIDEDIFSDQTEVTAAEDADLILVLDISETPDKIKFITKSNFIGEGLVAINNNVDNRILTGTGSAVNGEANLLFDGTILTNDGGEVNVDIASGDPHLSFQIGGTDEFTIGVDDDDSDSLKIDTGGTVGGATKLTLDTSGNMTLAGALTVTGNILPAADDTHDIGSASAAFQDLFLEGDITLTDAGTIATSAGDLTVDAEGDIILDANGANVTFKDDGTSILDIVNSSTDVEITVSTADKNLKFKGTDGSSAITALDIDMAAAGAATFNGDVVVGGLLKMTSNTASKILVADGSSFEEVAVGDLSEISSIANDDVFIAIDTTDGVLKKVSRSQVVSGLAASGAITDVVDDSTPQLGGDLDVNSNGLVSTSNGNIALTPNGSGVVRVDGSNGIDMESGAISIKNAGAESYVRFYCEVSNAHYTQLQASPHSAYGGNVTVVLPAAATNLVGDDTTQTLTNKTLTTPKIAEIDSLSSGNIVLDAEANIEINADGGTITFKDDSASLGTITSSGYSGTSAVATVATTVTITDNESTDEDNAVVFTAGGDVDGGNLGLESDGNLTYNPSSGTLSATSLAGTLTTAAQGNVTSLGTLTALTIDDVAVDGKVITMTGSSSDTAVFTAGTNGTLSIVTTDAAAAAANITITADGTFEADGTTITLDSGGDIVLDAAGNDINFKAGGTSVLDITNNSTDVELTVSTADKNFLIKGTDGSSAITALDIDMALAGKATFNGDVVVGGDLTITGDDLFMNTNTAGHILVGDDTNYNPVAVSGDVTLASNGAVTIADNAVESGMLNNNIISGLTEISSGLADADELLYSDAGTIKRVGLDTLTAHIQSGIGGDITGVTAGVGLSGGGNTGALTITLDLSELSSVTPASGDSLSTLDSDGANEQLTTVDNLATLFAGDGLAASSAVLGIDLGTNSGLEIASNKLQIAKGISQHDVAQFTSGVADNDFLRVDGTVIEGRSASEVLSDIGAQATLTFGISNTNAVKIDSASVADDEYARFTANGLESRSTSEVASDIGAATKGFATAMAIAL